MFNCPKHKIELVMVLKGGAGFCASCNLYVQSAGVPMPTRDIARRDTRGKKKSKPKPKTKVLAA